MWDTTLASSRETDVAVVGYGGAGAVAAITAADRGAKVLIVEKAASGGGNTRLSAGSVRTFGAMERAVEHITFLCGGATDPEVIEALVRESHDNEPWLRSLGGKVVIDPIRATPTSYPIYPTGAASPEQPGADGVGPRLRVKGETTDQRPRPLGTVGPVTSRNDASRCSSSAPRPRLLRDGDGAVNGLVAHRGGEEIVIRARKAVILTCGGYEWDPDMQLQFLGQRFWSLGASGHTGDGIRMAVDVGASLWHMNAVAAGFGYRVDGFDGAVIHAMPGPGFIYVDRNARRFADETVMDAHAVGSLVTELDLETHAAAPGALLRGLRRSHPHGRTGGQHRPGRRGRAVPVERRQRRRGGERLDQDGGHPGGAGGRAGPGPTRAGTNRRRVQQGLRR